MEGHEAEQQQPPPPLPMSQMPVVNGEKTKGQQRRKNRRVENRESRQLTFSKRKAGLWKKAMEIAVLHHAMITNPPPQ
jgi:hypothetical protein